MFREKREKSPHLTIGHLGPEVMEKYLWRGKHSPDPLDPHSQPSPRKELTSNLVSEWTKPQQSHLLLSTYLFLITAYGQGYIHTSKQWSKMVTEWLERKQEHPLPNLLVLMADKRARLKGIH